MFFTDKNQKLEQDIVKNNQALQQMLIHMDSLDKEINALLTELKVTPQQLEVFLANPDNFTTENWQELQKQRQLLEEKLQRDLANIRDPRQAQKSQESRNVQRHWLYVR
jgi:ABC-type Fe2+-enterobactin transport system substrate-binding protein